MTLNVNRRFPVCEVEFLLPDGEYKAIASGSPNDDLMSLTTAKQMGNPSGSFELSLVPRKYRSMTTGKTRGWEDVLVPNTLVYIRIYDDNKNKINVMTGTIDDISESFSMADGKPRRSINVSGRDFGKILEEFSIYYMPWYDPEAAMMKGIPWNQGLAIPDNASPADAMNIVLKRLLTNVALENGVIVKGYADIKWKNRRIVDGKEVEKTFKSLREMFKTRFENVDDAQIAMVPAFWGKTGQFWDILKSVSDPAWYELFVDSGRDVSKVVPSNKLSKNSIPNKMFAYTGQEKTSLDDGEFKFTGSDTSPLDADTLAGLRAVSDDDPVLFFRRMPFIDRSEMSKRWDALVAHVVRKEDIEYSSVSRSAREIYTMFHVVLNYYNNSDAAKWALGSDTFANADMAEQFGYKQMQVETTSIFQGAVGRENERANKLAMLLADWYVRNPYFYSGSYGIKGNPNIRIGERLQDDLRELEFYVQGVRHSFENFGAFKTTVDVVRGWDYKGKDGKSPSIYGLEVLLTKGAKQYLMKADGKEKTTPTDQNPAIVTEEEADGDF